METKDKKATIGFLFYFLKNMQNSKYLQIKTFYTSK